MSIRIIQTSEPLADLAVVGLRDRLRAGGLVAAGETPEADVTVVVRQIIADLQARGDEAIIEWERKLDEAELTSETIRVPAKKIDAAHKAAEPQFLELVRRTVANIREYQESILLKGPPPLVRGGRELSVRYTPIDRVGIYVPGGRAIYPSSFLMTIVPAKVAGVGQIALASPPRENSEVRSLLLALAGELGITEVYRLGGAVAIAAMAMGTASVPPVDKILGPGNAFVTEAKRQVFGRVGIDSTAGPSEVFIIADETADPAWVAADMLAQAEHDPGSAILATPSRNLAQQVAGQIDKQVSALDRADAARAAIDAYSAIIVVPDLDAACDVANDFATEHLQIITADDDAVLGKIRNAGAIFAGPHTPVPLGDYYAGPSHVLPTGGTARFFGPLSCNDFLKATSVVRYDAASLAADADDVIDFAKREGLTAHAQAIKIRTEK